MIYYIRDEEGSLIGFKYNNNTYYYLKNMQEDIIGIIDSNNNKLCSYEYDSWGKIISIKDNNNEETNPYYLNSRYYNPEWGRFINADGIINANRDILGNNLYVYVSNNPNPKYDFYMNASEKYLLDETYVGGSKW